MTLPADHRPFPTLIRWSALTDKGKVRANNEDAFLGVRFDARETSYLGKFGESAMDACDFVFAVSDGMGGAKSGEFASRIAVDKITKLLPKGFRLSALGMNAGQSDLLGELFAAIHREMLQLGRSYEECAGMGATLSLCWFAPGWMHFGHVGDSRIYLFPRDGGIRQISHDHSHVGWLRRQGKMNEREARNHPRRNALNQSLGAGHQFLEPHLGSVSYEPGDRFLICSDGVTDGLWDKHLDELIRTPEDRLAHLNPAQRVVALALENSGNDNTTALVLEIEEAKAEGLSLPEGL